MSDKLIVLLPGITMVLYFGTAIAFATKRDYPWCLVYAAYGVANIGLIFASIK